MGYIQPRSFGIVKERKDIVGLQFQRCKDTPTPAQPEIVLVTSSKRGLSVQRERSEPSRLNRHRIIERKLLVDSRRQRVVYVELIERSAIKIVLIFVANR